jgi:methyl-accepting chemotaxis protein
MSNSDFGPTTPTGNPQLNGTSPPSEPTPDLRTDDLGGERFTEDELLKKLLKANDLEQTGELDQALVAYQEIVALDGGGFYGESAKKALLGLHSERESSARLATAQTVSIEDKSSSWRRLRQRWDDLKFTNKLTLLLVSGAVLPIAVVTQSSIVQTQNRLEQQFQNDLKSKASSWEDDYVLWTEDDSLTEAENLSQLVQIGNIDLSNPSVTNKERDYLQQLVTKALAAGDRRADVTKSFRILTDSKGRTVAQGIKIHQSATAATYPPMPDPQRLIEPSEFSPISPKLGINLGDVEIIKHALQTGQAERGIELVSGEVMQRLGLETQARIPIRAFPNAKADTPARLNLPNPDLERSGLATIAVTPIKLNGKLVGTAIVGVLHNRHFALLDKFQQLVDAPAISVFANNWRVNTNLPFGDGTRALGTLAPEDITKTLLNKPYAQDLKDQVGQFHQEKIGNVNYLTYYRPLYNYQRQSDPQVIPIGMVAVGRSLDELDTLLARQQRLGLLVGAAMMLVMVAVAIAIAKAFARAIEDLAQFAQAIGKGEKDITLTATERGDEIGILARALTLMAGRVESNLDTVKNQEEMRRQEAQKQRQEKERLQRGVVNLLLEIEGAQQGDLTVYAPVTEGAVGSIADAFNTTIRRLRDLVRYVRQSADQVNALAMKSAPSMQQASQEAKIQAQEIQQTLMLVSHIGDLIYTVDEAAQQAATIAQQGANAATEGEAVMNLTVGSIDKIRDAVEETDRTVNRLTESCQQIQQILTLISGIAERTNLLAYNASIEASRAGENGQGFRVVAEEVRRLAGRTTEAAQSIEQIVETIQQETIDVQQAMATGKAEVVEGSDLVGRTKQTLKRLAETSQIIDRYLQSISQNTANQAQASEQVNQMMDRAAAITQTTSVQTESVAQSMQELVAVASTLKASVSQFKLDN